MTKPKNTWFPYGSLILVYSHRTMQPHAYKRVSRHGTSHTTISLPDVHGMMMTPSGQRPSKGSRPDGGSNLEGMRADDRNLCKTVIESIAFR